MNHLLRSLTALGLSALCVTAAVAVKAEPTPRVVPDYTVFLDPPTGFVFVKLPAGWKFVGKVEARDIARVPAGVVTSVVTRDDDAIEAPRWAARPTK